MDSVAKRLSSPSVKFVTTGASYPSPVGEFRQEEAENPSNMNNDSKNTVHQKSLNRNAVFSPVLTPNRGGSMVLLSPSRTISDSLTSLATSTGKELENIWEEVGYSPEDRASQLSELLFEFKQVCERKVADESRVRDTFKQTISEAKEEIRSLSAALKTFADPNLLKENDGQSLTYELATLEATLEGLRAAALAAKEDMVECKDYITEAHEALGMKMDPKWRDIESDLTKTRQEEFRRKKAEMKEELSTRAASVVQLVRTCQQLTNDLRIDVEKDGKEIDRKIAGSLVRSKDGGFIMVSKFQTKTCVGISSSAVGQLEKRAAELHKEKVDRKAKLADIGEEISTLWEKLRIPEEEQIAFTKTVKGLGMETVVLGQRELERLRVLKSQKLGELIEESRQTILSLWEQTNTAPKQRAAFLPFKAGQDEFSDELLERHEAYITELMGILEHMKPILRMIERREDIIRERIEYEEVQKDPDRLKQRGANLTRQLMEEEKMAKRIKKDLPRLTELLIDKLHDWREELGEDFQYGGEVYVEVMERQEQEWLEYKEAQAKRKLKQKHGDPGQLENRPAKFGPHKALQHRPLMDGGARLNVRRNNQPNIHAPTKSDAPARLLGQTQRANKL